MKFSLYLIATLIMCASCQDQPSAMDENINAKKTNAKEEILGVLKIQQDSWNQGDVKGFMNHYLNSQELTFAGINGITKGHEQVLNRYLSNYDTVEKMGSLNFNVLEFRELSSTSAYVIGEWALQRATDNPSGYFTLVWEKVNGEWKIIHDHTS